jgi:hypothetical protein
MAAREAAEAATYRGVNLDPKHHWDEVRDIQTLFMCSLAEVGG